MGLTFHATGTLDPPEVRNWRIHTVAIVASMGALALGYDTAVIGGTMALESFRTDFQMDTISNSARDTIQANIVSTFQAGCFFGALFSFPVADKLGRKKAIMLAALILALGGALMTGCRGSMGIMIAGRLIGGLGMGVCSLTVPVYLSEVSPPSIRGRLVGIFEVISQSGAMLGFWINYATDQTIPDTNSAQWIIPLALQLFPAVSLFFGILWCPESPRWLARSDNFDGAQAVLVYLRHLPADHWYIGRELGEMREQVQERSTNRLPWKEQAKKLFQKGTRNRWGIGLLIMFLQSFTGVNIITYYSPRIFETLGISGTSVKLFSTGFYGIAKTLGMITFAVYTVEKVGRRNGLIWGGIIGSIPMWYIGGYVMQADPAAAAARGDVHRDGWGYLAMVSIYFNAFVICATWQGITWTYASEIFPLDIRMLCVATTTASTWLGSFVVGRSTPFMISDLGYGCYFFFSTCLVLMALWAFIFVPETKGVTLEEMDALFSKPMHRVVWAQLRGKASPTPDSQIRDADNEKIETSVQEIEKQDR